MTMQDRDVALAATGAAYNYAHFSRSEAAGHAEAFKGTLRAGDEAPDFELPTPEGEQVRLSSFRGEKHVVLEFSSVT